MGSASYWAMSTIHDPRYRVLISDLIQLRKLQDVTQTGLAEKLDKPQNYVWRVENLERRLDVIELQDWLSALNARIKITILEDEG